MEFHPHGKVIGICHAAQLPVINLGNFDINHSMPTVCELYIQGKFKKKKKKKEKVTRRKKRGPSKGS